MKLKLTAAALMLGTALIGCTSDQAPLTDNGTATTGGTTATGGATTTGGTTGTVTGGTTATGGTTTTGGTTSGGGTTGSQVSAPTATARSFTDLGNTPLNVTAANGLLQGNAGATVTVVSPTSKGGTVTVNADGSFTYTPPANFTGGDTFSYTLTNSAGSSSATVTVTISAVGFFVSNTAAAGGNGTFGKPFQTLAQAAAAAAGQNGAQIVVFKGDGTSNGYNTAITLGANQGLVGQDPANPPLLTGPIAMAGGNNTLAFVQVLGSAGVAVDGTGASNGTITNCTIANGTGIGVNLVNSTGTWTVSNSTVNNNEGLLTQTNAGNLVCSVSDCTFALGISGIQANVTQTGTQNLTVANCSFSQLGNASFPVAGVSAVANSTAGGFFLFAFNNNADQCSRGFALLTDNNIQMSTLLQNNTITNSSDIGVEIGNAVNTTNTLDKLHIYSNTVSNSSQNVGFGLASGIDPAFLLDLNQNIAHDVTGYELGGNMTVANLSTLQARNTGTFLLSSANLTSGNFTFP